MDGIPAEGTPADGTPADGTPADGIPADGGGHGEASRSTDRWAATGLVVRRATVADSAAVGDVCRAARAARGAGEVSVVDPAPGPDEVSRMLLSGECEVVADGDGDVAGVSYRRRWVEADGTPVLLARGWVRPDRCGQGIGSAMLGRALGRAGSAVVAANATVREHEAVALLEAHGLVAQFTTLEYELAAHVEVPEAVPAWLGVRAAEVGDHGVLVAQLNEAYAGQPFCEEVGLGYVADAQLRWWVALAGGEVVGGVAMRDHGAVDEVAEVVVDARWRRRGVARALLGVVLAGGRSKPVRLATGGSNPHRAFELYESVGFGLVETHVRFRTTG